ncbi:MAG: citryl-CoA lyase [Cycloclasticus sp.]|jgi:citrate synthase|uniref:citryl-CoA lyase n=1 Tax=Cycloclasticus sp. TaxID=2024830 RepID=UPI00257F5D10|nr:citryl-CoA lyase [Cycloclasticus sp.]MBV1898050.1 citryl-CoA lyase [Cycloclasticus sp.]
MEQEKINTKIWFEEEEPDNPFAAKASYCSGYNVYGDLLGKISWSEYIFLLFKLEKPLPWQSELLEAISIAIANPGPRDLGVRAAMNGGVGGSTAASCLMAALAPSAGKNGGAREVYQVMRLWQQCEFDLPLWLHELPNYQDEVEVEVWPASEHTPGFDPYGASCATPILQTLDHLTSIYSDGALAYLSTNRQIFEKAADAPLGMTGVIAAAFTDLGFTDEQAEMLYLLLRLPGAAAHSLEQKKLGWRKYPFFGNGLTLTNDPGPLNSNQTFQDKL